MSETIELWRCKECGYVTSAEPKGSIGTIHSHIDGKHRPWYSWADIEKLDEMTEKIRVKVEKVIEEIR